MKTINQPRTDVVCDTCEKHVLIAYFSDSGRELDFCSAKCQQKWIDWSVIDPEFAEISINRNLTYQQLWEDEGISYFEAEKWVN